MLARPTDPCGTADIAAALTALGASVLVITDEPAFSIVSDVVCYRAPKAKLMMLPKTDTEDFIRSCIKNFSPTHFISLERPGKAANGHYHSMRGEVLDDMITDSALFLSEAKKAGAVTISIGDGGNEMGMGTYRECDRDICPVRRYRSAPPKPPISHSQAASPTGGASASPPSAPSSPKKACSRPAPKRPNLSVSP